MHSTHQDLVAPIWIDLKQRNGTSWFWDSINQEPKYTHWYKEGEPSNNNKTEGEPGNRVLINIESPLSSNNVPFEELKLWLWLKFKSDKIKTRCYFCWISKMAKTWNKNMWLLMVRALAVLMGTFVPLSHRHESWFYISLSLWSRSESSNIS